MMVRPNFFAAGFYALLALFLSASWAMMSLDGNDLSSISLRFVRWAFSRENEQRVWFTWFAIATILAPVLMISFLWGRAPSPAVAAILATIAGAYLILSLWQFDTAITFCAGAAFVCAVFGWWRAA
jgi:hypothetical protein